MKGITWSRDSHGLFDYESRHLTKKTMKTSGAAQIVRKNNDLDLNSLENQQLPYKSTIATEETDARPLLNIVNENGKLDSKLALNAFISLIEYWSLIINLLCRYLLSGKLQRASKQDGEQRLE